MAPLELIHVPNPKGAYKFPRLLLGPDAAADTVQAYNEMFERYVALREEVIRSAPGEKLKEAGMYFKIGDFRINYITSLLMIHICETRQEAAVLLGLHEPDEVVDMLMCSLLSKGMGANPAHPGIVPRYVYLLDLFTCNFRCLHDFASAAVNYYLHRSDLFDGHETHWEKAKQLLQSFADRPQPAQPCCAVPEQLLGNPWPEPPSHIPDRYMHRSWADAQQDRAQAAGAAAAGAEQAAAAAAGLEGGEVLVLEAADQAAGCGLQQEAAADDDNAVSIILGFGVGDSASDDEEDEEQAADEVAASIILGFGVGGSASDEEDEEDEEEDEEEEEAAAADAVSVPFGFGIRFDKPSWDTDISEMLAATADVADWDTLIQRVSPFLEKLPRDMRDWAWNLQLQTLYAALRIAPPADQTLAEQVKAAAFPAAALVLQAEQMQADLLKEKQELADILAAARSEFAGAGQAPDAAAAGPDQLAAFSKLAECVEAFDAEEKLLKTCLDQLQPAAELMRLASSPAPAVYASSSAAAASSSSGSAIIWRPGVDSNAVMAELLAATDADRRNLMLFPVEGLSMPV